MELKDKIRTEGVNSMGYGMFPKSVAKDTRTNWRHVAIYAYFVSYAGGGMQAFPSIKTICTDLNIHRETLTKYLNELIIWGYIKKEQVRNVGKFSSNIYTICMNPQETEIEKKKSPNPFGNKASLPKTKKPTTVKKPKSKNTTTVPKTENTTSAVPSYNINKSFINNNKYNNHHHLSNILSNTKEKEKPKKQKMTIDDVRNMILNIAKEKNITLTENQISAIQDKLAGREITYSVKRYVSKVIDTVFSGHPITMPMGSARVEHKNPKNPFHNFPSRDIDFEEVKKAHHKALMEALEDGFHD